MAPSPTSPSWPGLTRPTTHHRPGVEGRVKPGHDGEGGRGAADPRRESVAGVRRGVGISHRAGPKAPDRRTAWCIGVHRRASAVPNPCLRRRVHDARPTPPDTPKAIRAMRVAVPGPSTLELRNTGPKIATQPIVSGRATRAVTCPGTTQPE